MVVIGDVPVDAGKEFVVALIGWEVGIRTCVISIFVLHVFLHSSQVGQCGARKVVVGIGNAVLRGAPAVGNCRNLSHFTIHEEEQFVLDDWATQSKTIDGVAVFVASTGKLLAADGVTTHVLIAVIDVGAALEGVVTTLGDGVHATANEVGLTNVIRRNNHLHLLNSVDRDWVATTRQVRAKTEVVVEVCTVNGEVGSTAIGTCKTHSIASIRREACHVGDAAANRWQISDLHVGNVG